MVVDDEERKPTSLMMLSSSTILTSKQSSQPSIPFQVASVFKKTMGLDNFRFESEIHWTCCVELGKDSLSICCLTSSKQAS
uniref:Uncharacterized protein n=1 Tax=Physcomitrium patens TaxID=3218 RepID=A0A2K1LAP3_PHYPA|nr:hypothetical protein PHYPA_001516 [Physcomitrium patens]